MSTDIFIQSIRKSDYCPFERIYLGGNRLKREIENEPSEATVMGCQVSKFQDWQAVKDFVTEYQDTISSYISSFENENDFDYFEAQGDDFYYWLVVEE